MKRITEQCIEFSLGGCITIDEFQIDDEGGPESYRAFYAVRSGVPIVLRIERDINAPRRTPVWVADRLSNADTERLEKLIDKALRIAERERIDAAYDEAAG